MFLLKIDDERKYEKRKRKTDSSIIFQEELLHKTELFFDVEYSQRKLMVNAQHSPCTARVEILPHPLEWGPTAKKIDSGINGQRHHEN